MGIALLEKVIREMRFNKIDVEPADVVKCTNCGSIVVENKDGGWKCDFCNHSHTDSANNKG